MSYKCFKCGCELNLASPTSVGRKEECQKCSADLHACLNCIFYDENAYNKCKEPQAERVTEKDRSNFCDFFKFTSKQSNSTSTGKETTLKALDDLFK